MDAVSPDRFPLSRSLEMDSYPYSSCSFAGVGFLPTYHSPNKFHTFCSGYRRDDIILKRKILLPLFWASGHSAVDGCCERTNNSCYTNNGLSWERVNWRLFLAESVASCNVHFSSFASVMYISEASGSASHPREDRYEVHEGDIIFNRCTRFEWTDWQYRSNYKDNRCWYFPRCQILHHVGKCSTVTVAWDSEDGKHVPSGYWEWFE